MGCSTKWTSQARTSFTRVVYQTATDRVLVKVSDRVSGRVVVYDNTATFFGLLNTAVVETRRTTAKLVLDNHDITESWRDPYL